MRRQTEAAIAAANPKTEAHETASPSPIPVALAGVVGGVVVGGGLMAARKLGQTEPDRKDEEE